MQRSNYLVVGGGMTGDAACKGIRAIDADGTITLVGDELHPPYARPPLSKQLWQGKAEETIWRGTEEQDVDLRLGRRIVDVDLDARLATDDAGETYGYERLLLATGGRPRRLSEDAPGVVYFRTLDDYRALREQAGPGERAIVVGGGFIGSEVAAALAASGTQVTLAFPEDALGARLFPPDLAAFLNDFFREHGVDVLPGERIAGVEPGFRVRTAGRTLDADIVVVGIGLEPNDELAAAAGLTVANGIVVDDHGRAGGRHDVYAAGDVARFPLLALDTETRVEHEDHAKSHGRAVGANMAGADEVYDHLPFFYSDLFELGYEAVGEVDSRRETLAEWLEPFRKGAVAYLDRERRPRGFLLWDVWGKVDAASELIRAAEPVDASTLRELAG